MTWPDKELEGKERVKARDRVCNWMRAHSGFFNRGEGGKKSQSYLFLAAGYRHPGKMQTGSNRGVSHSLISDKKWTLIGN